MTKDFNDPKYWDAFARHLLDPKMRPTCEEAGEFVVSLMVKVRQANEGKDKAERDAKIAKQQFEVFAMEASNNLSALARKYTL